MGPNITYMHQMLKNISIVYGNEDATEKACDMNETTHFPEVWFWFVLHPLLKLNISVLHIQHASGPYLLCSLPNDDQCTQGCLPDSSQLSLFGYCPLSVLEHVWQSRFFAADTWWVTTALDYSHLYAKMNFWTTMEFSILSLLVVFRTWVFLSFCERRTEVNNFTFRNLFKYKNI